MDPFYEGLLDGIVGFKGRYNFTEQWFIPFSADVGAGQSDLTYQLIGGIGYGGDWGDVSLTYRHFAWHLGDDSFSCQDNYSSVHLGRWVQLVNATLKLSQMPNYVTYVSGMKCNLCVRMCTL